MLEAADDTKMCDHTAVAAEFDNVVAHGVDPYPIYATARATAPVFYSRRYRVWCVTRHDDIVSILRDPTTFSAESRSVRPGWAPPVAAALTRLRDQVHVANTDPPRHTRLRKVLNQTFSTRRIAAYEPMIRRVVDDLIDRFDPGEIDLISKFTDPFPLAVILQIIGIPLDEMDRCREWVRKKAALEYNFEAMSVEEQVDAADACVSLQDYCDDLVRKRREQPADDMVSHMFAATPAGSLPLTVHEISDHLPTIILAGHETTSKVLSGLMWRLASHPDYVEELRRNPAAIPIAVEEGLRINAPALALARRATRHVQVHGVDISAGSKLLLLYGSGNHDEAKWNDSEKFLLDRDQPTAHLAFGHGVHFCLGAPLARLEAQVGLERLLARQPMLRLAENSASLEWSTNLVFRGLRRLPISWDPEGCQFTDKRRELL